MAGIDDIIAGGAGASSRADFSGIPKLLDSYWAGKDQAAKNDLREAFKGGVPTNPDGSLDISSVMKTLFQKGDIAGGTGLIGQVAGAQDRSDYIKSLGPAPPQPANYGPPATGRNAVAPDPSVRAPVSAVPAGTASPAQGQGGETPASFLDKQGISGYNREVGLSYFKRNGIDPDQPFNPNDPAVAQKLGPVLNRLKSVGQVQPPQPGDIPPQQVAQQQPQAPQGFQPSPAQVAAQNDPELKRARYFAVSNDKAIAEANRAEVKMKLEAQQPTNEMKNAAAPGLLERQGEQAAQQAGAVEAAKGYVAKYQAIDEVATKAIQEIPKLQMAVKLMDSPDFQSGSGQRFDLMYRRLAVRLGGDPDKAAPQEIVSKVIADSVLNGLGSLKGLGPLRVAEMNLARTAAMSMDNTPETNRFLANVAIRIQKRAVEVSDIAQNYNDGVLDVGFDKKIREMDKKNPLFTPDEVQRFQKIIGGEEKKQGAQPANRQAAAAPAAFPNAKQAPDGNFYVPDPARPGKYLKVVQ
jgi:hypothetical protein